MITNRERIREYAHMKGIKVYEVAMIMGIAESNLYQTYMHSVDEDKYNKVKDAIDEYLGKAGADID